jgi:hypothetical protein
MTTARSTPRQAPVGRFRRAQNRGAENFSIEIMGSIAQSRKRRFRKPRIRGRVVMWLERQQGKCVRPRVPAPKEFGDDGPIPPASLFHEQLTPKAMRVLIALKGWTIVDLASWWEMRPETLLRHVADRCRPRRIDDMVWGLPPYEEPQSTRPTSDWWRRLLLQHVADLRQRTEYLEHTHPRRKVSSFVRHVGKFPGHLISPNAKSKPLPVADDARI